MANEKILVIAVIGIVILAGAVTMVLRGGNQEPIVGNAKMFSSVDGFGCGVFSTAMYKSATARQLDNYCGSYCVGYEGDNSHTIMFGHGTMNCCCDINGLG